MDLQNKITVIAGVTGGLGRVVAREFAEQGAKLVLVGTNAERLAQLVAELKLNPESYVTVVADLTQSGAAQEVLEAALDPDFDTVTLYVGPQRQPEYYDYVAALYPRRVIFNPGTENPPFAQRLQQAGISTEEACTLVLLATQQY